MKGITGIHHIGIRVTSLERARAFYEKLGFVFIVGPIGPEPIAIMEHPAGININLILNGDTDSNENILLDVPERHTGYTHIAFAVKDIVDAQRSIQGMGIDITEGLVTLADGNAMFFIRDQDGNVIEIHQGGEQLSLAVKIA